MILRPNRGSHLIMCLRALFALIKDNVDGLFLNQKGAFRQFFSHWAIFSNQINTAELNMKLYIGIYLVEYFFSDLLLFNQS